MDMYTNKMQTVPRKRILTRENQVCMNEIRSRFAVIYMYLRIAWNMRLFAWENQWLTFLLLPNFDKMNSYWWVHLATSDSEAVCQYNSDDFLTELAIRKCKNGINWSGICIRQIGKHIVKRGIDIDIYFFEVNTKYISSSVLKTSEFSIFIDNMQCLTHWKGGAENAKTKFFSKPK